MSGGLNEQCDITPESKSDSSSQTTIQFHWEQIATDYLHELVINTINKVISEANDAMMGGYAFIEDFSLGTNAPEITLKSIDHCSERHVRAQVHIKYFSDLHVKAQAFQQINPFHYLTDNLPPGVKSGGSGPILQNPKVKRRGRMMMRSLDSDQAGYISVWGLVYDLQVENLVTIDLYLPSPSSLPIASLPLSSSSYQNPSFPYSPRPSQTSALFPPSYSDSYPRDSFENRDDVSEDSDETADVSDVTQEELSLRNDKIPFCKISLDSFPLKSVNISCSMDNSVIIKTIYAKIRDGLAMADKQLRQTNYKIYIPLPDLA